MSIWIHPWPSLGHPCQTSHESCEAQGEVVEDAEEDLGEDKAGDRDDGDEDETGTGHMQAWWNVLWLKLHMVSTSNPQHLACQVLPTVSLPNEKKQKGAKEVAEQPPTILEEAKKKVDVSWA